jgi:signal peptidase I
MNLLKGLSIFALLTLTVGPPASAQESAGRFTIPSRSMQPTLMPGTTHAAVKYAKGATPARGDLIVFRVPKDPKTNFVFRVVGLPGERIQMMNGLLHINGEAVKREPMDDFVDKDEGETIRVKRWRETLPGGVSHETIDLTDKGPFDNTEVFTVPAGSLFVMGDSRDNAQDSRLPHIGPIPLANVVGRIVRP